MKIWYAIVNSEDIYKDWGTGSYDLDEAESLAEYLGCDEIDVIDEENEYCIDEIIKF